MADIVERLATDAAYCSERLGATIRTIGNDCSAARAEILHLRTALAEAREVIGPFARLAEDYLTGTVNFDNSTIMAGRVSRRNETDALPRVLFSDFRRARDFLTRTENGNG